MKGMHPVEVVAGDQTPHAETDDCKRLRGVKSLIDHGLQLAGQIRDTMTSVIGMQGGNQAWMALAREIFHKFFKDASGIVETVDQKDIHEGIPSGWAFSIGVDREG